MLLKPFKPPSFIRPSENSSGKSSSSTDPADDPPPHKKQRLENGAEERPSGKPAFVQPPKIESGFKPPGKLVFRNPGISSLPRKPLETIPNPGEQSTSSSNGMPSTYYNVLWRKPTTKKHKTWDGDGILRVSEGYAYLQDVSGRGIGRTTCTGPLLPGSTLFIAGRDVEVESIMPKEEYFSGRRFLNVEKPSAPQVTPMKPLKPLNKAEVLEAAEAAKKTLNVAAPKSTASTAKYKNPMLDTTTILKQEGDVPTPRHDPNAEGALVMKPLPTSLIPKGKKAVDVVVDPLLSKHLRAHQREGVKFLYECVMGLRDVNGFGAILADDMGLGKTLQTITLLWTLLKQNPVFEEPPVIKKALIVCPVTLINNWRKEIRKWLGRERVGVYVAEGNKTRLSDFTRGKSYSIMIIGYERLRMVHEELQKGAGIDIVIADEGHRLKTTKNKATQAINTLNTDKRIILSGTPIQNELSEFYAMVDFVNPGILGKWNAFSRTFEKPIERSRQPDATEKEIELGEGRSEALNEETNKFILRRTADVLSKYLPPKTEYVLLCKPTPTQAQVYQHVLASPAFQSALGNAGNALQQIQLLSKVCNSPSLLNAETSKDGTGDSLAMTIAQSLPARLIRGAGSSMKIRLLESLLHQLRKAGDEKIVLVSNWTSTLDLLQNLLQSLDMPYLRLDGTVSASKRQDLVDDFNRAPSSRVFAFLLSAKAGGMGINLIGASRLVLFDVDWNPAVDAQAMARIHREGQKRPCMIYRFLMGGSLDEKIWQRQITKLGLASGVMEGKAGVASFTKKELRDLFRLDETSLCQTHDLIACKCGGRGVVDDEDEDTESGNTTKDDAVPVIEEANDKDSEVIVIDDAEEDQPEPQARTGFRPSSTVDMTAQEESIANAASARTRSAKPGEKMHEYLMSYAHIDTSRFHLDEDEDQETLIRDQVLFNVLKQEENPIRFVFAKTTT